MPDGNGPQRVSINAAALNKLNTRSSMIAYVSVNIRAVS
jgi:hypothetical protein